MEASRQVLLLLAAVAAAALVALVLVLRAWMQDRRRHARELADARRDSVQRSRSTLKGQIAEQLAPVLPGFPYPPADARFVGDPVDYIVFDGASAVRDGGGDGLDVVLLEVKQGTSALSPLQRAIRRAVEEGRVRFELLRIGEDGAAALEQARPRGKGELPR